MKRLSFLLSILALAAVPARAEDPVTVVGFSRSAPSVARPRNDLMRFCGCLKGVDARAMRAAQEDFSKIDPEMWK